MIKTKIPYQETGCFSKIISDYLDENESLTPFYNYNTDIESFQKIIEEKAQKEINREVLVKVLYSQYENLSPLTKKNIDVLNNENSYTVTTGHQLNLFTGPLYFIYKIISTINLAKELKQKYPNNDFVPVYWMATEDHDFDEVNHFNLFKKRYELAKNQSGAVGKMKLEGVEQLIIQLQNDLNDRNGVDELVELFSKYYTSSNTYSEATRGIVNYLFGKYGLVIIDGDDASLKGGMLEEFKSELIERKNHEVIKDTSDKHENLGYKAQLNPREINLFYLKENFRERITFEEDKYKVLNSSLEFSESEMVDELVNHPDRFSPNAAMRCLYQEKILPNLAYIGGGGELAYWLQLKAMFDANNISYPILILRNSVLMVDAGSKKRLDKLNLKAEDLFKEVNILIKEYLKNSSDINLTLGNEQQKIEAIFNEVVSKVKAVDSSMEGMVNAELQKTLKGLKNIEGRLMKAEKKKQEVSVNQITNLKDKLFPNSSLQERHENLLSVLLFYGEDVIDELINHLNPLEKEFVILSAE